MSTASKQGMILLIQDLNVDADVVQMNMVFEFVKKSVMLMAARSKQHLFLSFILVMPEQKNIEVLTARIVAFCEARDWKQFHNPKDLALSLVLEATEVMEHFQWKNPEEIQNYLGKTENKKAVGEELADTLYWILLTAHYLDVDVAAALEQKMTKNEERYPVEKAKGRHLKYTEL